MFPIEISTKNGYNKPKYFREGYIMKKFTALACALAILLTLVPAKAAGNPVYVGAQGAMDMARDDLEADVSCMSFNVMHYNSSTVQNLASGSYANRIDCAVGQIGAYDPDIIGMQEAGSDGTHSEDWPTDLTARIGSTYTPIILTDQTTEISQMYITAALIIWYRTDRFTLLDSGAESYGSCSVDCAVSDKKRWFQWAKLYDNQENKTLFVFNTHLSTNHSASTCSVCGDSTAGAAAGRAQRTAELTTLAAKIESLSANYPCFVTGDFNCNLTSSASYADQLTVLTDTGYLQSALTTADLQITSEGKSSIDHVFLNTDYLRCRKLVGSRESVNSYLSTDHYPYIAYCDYRAAATIGPGVYDEIARTYTDTTSANQYTFQVTPGDGFTYQIYKDTGARTGDTIWSVKDTSCYEIRFYDADGALYSTVAATIYASAAAKPTLSSTGLNQYFANHAYHVLASGDSVTITPTCSGSNTAALYADADCTTALSETVTGIGAGRTTCYLKHNVYKSDGTLNFYEVFPLYIYRETAQPKEMTLYIDQNIGNSTGTVAFFDGVDVIFAQGQTTGFDSLTDAQPTVNTADGYAIYMAPGEYEGNASSFTKSFHLYGANHDISPNERVVEGTWALADRRAETVINGQLLISLYGNDVTTKTIGITGVTFTGETTQGSIYLIENRGGTGSSYWAANSAYRVDLDIRNNIFLGWATQSSSADINLNCASQKSGTIACNYFQSIACRSVSSDTAAYPLTYDKAIFGRNINGLTIDSNRFLDFGKDFITLTAQPGYGSILPGYAVFTVSDNRFENCVSTLGEIRNITADTQADAAYLGNYFLRCGYGTGSIFVDVTETSGAATAYENCALTVLGNKFYESERCFGIFRNGGTLSGDINAMALTLSQNVFRDPCERPMQPKNGYSAGTAAENYIYSYQSYNYSPLYFRLANAGQTAVSVPDSWNLSYNYFYCARMRNDLTNPYHPSLYINSYMKEWANGAISAEYECLDSSLAEAFLPYYTDIDCTAASSTAAGTYPSSTAVSAVSGITATGYSGYYDGQPHSISVTAPAGATVSYSYGDSAENAYKNYSAENPAFTDIGTYTVTYRVTAPGCAVTYGSATVVIEEPASLTAPTTAITGISLVFEDEICYNIYYTADDLSNVVDMGLVTFSEKLADGTHENAIDIIPGYEAIGSEYRVHTNGIPAKNMGDALYFRVYALLTDGSYVYSDVAGYHAGLYAKSMLNSTTSSAALKSLCVAMVNYGAEAQLYFGYKTDSLMNAFLTEEQKNLISPYDESMISAITAADTAKTAAFLKNAAAFGIGVAVNFEGAFAVNYYFTVKYAIDSEVTMYFWDEATYNSAAALTKENATSVQTMTLSGSEYLGIVSGIAAKEIDQTLYVSAVFTSGGEECTSGVLAYSLGYYCKSKAADSTSPMQSLAAATGVYGYYAKQYFGS